MIAKTLRVKGRVQGVGFRYFTKELADSYHLSGFVKNLSNGQVYIEVQGEEDLIEYFVDRVKQGPDWAYVEECLVVDSEVSSISGFSIRP